MLLRLFLLFVAFPVLELLLLVQIGRAIGLVPTVLLVLFTGFGGAWLARAEGLRVLRGFQAELARGRIPERAAFDGVCILAGGLMLLMPGVLSDVVGLALLFPPTRRLVQTLLRRRIERGIRRGTIRMTTIGGASGFGFGGPGFGGPGFGGSGSGHRVHPDARPDDAPDLDPRYGIEVPSKERDDR